MIGKRAITAILTVALVLGGLPACSLPSQSTATGEDGGVKRTSPTPSEPQFNSLSDSDQQRYLEDATYNHLVEQLDTDKYFVENIQSSYVSQEYLDELEYNSKTNIYFGYTLDKLEKQFQGKKYVFTPGKNGHTEVTAVGKYDDTYNQVVKNVAVGGGVILVCVTISAVTAGTGATAASAIFAVAAKSGCVVGSTSAIVDGTIALVEVLQSGNPEKALKSAALSGSKGFKIGAIGGAIAGGAGEAAALHGAALNGLTMNEAAKIQKESKYPLDVIKQFHNMKEYEVYKQAGLKTQMVDGKTALVQDINLNYKSLSPDGKNRITNLDRMRKGYAPIDPATGQKYQLHHVGQKADGTLAVLTREQHQGNAGLLNVVGKKSEINRKAFKEVRERFWKSFAENNS